MSEVSAEHGISPERLQADLQQRWLRHRRLEPVPDQPVVHLLRDGDSDQLLSSLENHLGSNVPHARLDVGEEPPSVERRRSVQIRDLLDSAAGSLREHDSWPRVGRLRFPRYTMLSWLLQQNDQRPELTHRPGSNIRDRLHDYLIERGRRRRKNEADGESRSAAWNSAAEQLPWYLFVLSLLLFPLYYGLWVRFGRVPRWFMRQHYLAPRESADFPAFAQRLISTPSQWENAQEVRKLLVHAFLADLSDTYTRRVWRWRWVPRDSYPVLLLADLEPGTIGEALVGLLNDVRNETGATDPLLVIGSGAEPLRGEETSQGSAGLDGWQKSLQDARRRRSPTAWYVPLRVGSAPDEPGFGRALPLLKRSRLLRRLPALGLIVLLLGTTGGYFVHREQHCGLWTPWANPDLSTTALWESTGECIGISDGGYQFSRDMADAAELVQLQKIIAEQNRLAEQNHVQYPDRPYATIVYFGTLTTADADSTTLAGTVEELKGLINAQRDARIAQLPLRILLANGGAAMRRGAEVAERIAALAERETEAPVVGVVGMGGSWRGTDAAIKRLERATLPMVGITTSADHLPGLSKLYHQIAPSNAQEARVVGSYVRAMRPAPPTGVTVYYDQNDPYSNNLAEDVHRELAPSTPRLRMDPRGNPTAFWQEIPCGQDELAFFSGRADQLGAFLSAVQRRCGDLPNYPRLLASDDTTKFVLDHEMRERRNVVLDYVSFNGVPAWDSGLDGRSLLARDSIAVLQQAILNVKATPNGVPLNGATVWSGINQIYGLTPVHGTSGDIDYGSASGQIPVDKAIFILRVHGGTQQTERILTCGKPFVEAGPCPG
ncbi:hypothetical protein QFW96_13605 [Saccharopolyspora sp. TS4A08]|uniref:ABC transporter substrate-binding protein n=1 Tax=Saccharopolyspora ipomoeae TaxID=3042027 RepID=A0ABT6PNT5_9PSEU|nr:hypothetical protein [Saccharopolyspora sp. TS4A08]MDI2029661.1 hypothetical protein [Saccharopolyspora sp. TS4A08]